MEHLTEQQLRALLGAPESRKLLQMLQASGSDTLARAAAAARAGNYAQVEQLLKRSFRPEFLNRLDEIVFYKPLTKADVTRIIDLQIKKLNGRLEQQQIRCHLTEEAKAAIVDAAYDPQYGARPLRRYVQHTVETMLSKRLLRGEVLPGQTVTVDAADGELIMK